MMAMAGFGTGSDGDSAETLGNSSPACIEY